MRADLPFHSARHAVFSPSTSRPPVPVLRFAAVALLLLSLAACDTTDAYEEPDRFVPGEVLAVLQPDVEFSEFRAYVEADPALTWKEVVAETAARIVLLGVPVGEEEATATRLELEAPQFVQSVSLNNYVYLD